MENVAQGYYIDSATFLLFVPSDILIQNKEHNIFGITYAQPDINFDVKSAYRSWVTSTIIQHYQQIDLVQCWSA
jgi:hypothetical protein